MSEKAVITRFPPSPTGLLHVGSVRTALFNFLFARQNNGQFVLRIENTDQERSKVEFEEDLIAGLRWLGLTYDNPVVVRQSERGEVYQKYLQKMIDAGHAYISKETPTEEGGRTEVIRFKNPNKQITFTDIIRGDVTFDTTDLKDFVIAKSLTEPLYHLAVVVDDFEAGVTHVIRGEDGISNTPRQILIQEAIGAPRPVYAHLPLILDADRSKLSKRKHGEKVALRFYKDQGFLPQAIINYMALLGWNPGTEQEIFTLDELIKLFDISKVQKAGAVFNPEKLRWVNKQHMLLLPKEDLHARLKEILNMPTISGELLEKLTPVLTERADTFGDIKTAVEAGEYSYVFEAPDVAVEKLYWKEERDSAKLAERLDKVAVLLESVPEKDFTPDIIKQALWEYASAEGRGQVLWPTRMALSGKDKSPDPFILASLLGKSETLSRIKSARAKVI